MQSVHTRCRKILWIAREICALIIQASILQRGVTRDHLGGSDGCLTPVRVQIYARYDWIGITEYSNRVQRRSGWSRCCHRWLGWAADYTAIAASAARNRATTDGNRNIIEIDICSTTCVSSTDHVKLQ